jgi:predicted AlkP superfamily phosphohydrolase/phosphomutase
VLAVITLDAACVSLVERLLDQGRMPALAELHDRGTWRQLTTPATHFSAGVYQTLYSGRPLAEHGLYFPFQWSAAEQRLRYMTHFPAPESIWDRIAGAGRRSVAIDAWESRPLRPEAGVHLSGWQLTNRSMLRRWSAPSGLHSRLARRFGRPATIEEVYGSPSVAGLLRVRRRLLDAPARAALATEELLGRERPDLLWVGLPAVHVGGHQLFDPSSQLSSSGGLAGGPPIPAELEGGLVDLYAAADAAIGRIVAALPGSADVIVLSAVGMGVNTSRSDLLPGMLDAVLAHDGERTEGSGRPNDRKGVAGTWVWRLRARVPTGLRAAIARALPGRALQGLLPRVELRGIDWSRTSAFALPTDQHGYMRLNVRGRERDGIVDPAEADALMEQLEVGLSTFCDPDGTPSVGSVDRVSDLVGTAPGAPIMPDLVVRWGKQPATRLAGVSSPRYGDVRRGGRGSGRSGNHTSDAWALLVPAASRLRTPTRPPDIVDIPATACSLLGVDADGLAGQPLLERP